MIQHRAGCRPRRAFLHLEALEPRFVPPAGALDPTFDGDGGTTDIAIKWRCWMRVACFRLSMAALLWGACVSNVAAQTASWKDNVDASWKLYQEGKYVEAEKLMKVAVEQAKNLDGLSLARSLNGLGLIQYRLGKYAEAAKALQQAVPLFETHAGPAHLETGGGLNILAMAYWGWGKHKEAEALFPRVLDIWGKGTGPTSKQFANVLNSIGGLYQDKGDGAKAERYLLRSLAIWEQRQFDDPESPFVLFNLAHVRCYSQDKVKEARDLMQRAVELTEKMQGRDHPQLAMFLSFVADICLDLNDTKEAQKAALRALAIFDDKQITTQPYRASALAVLGECYHLQGKLAQAEEVLRPAVADWTKIAPWSPETTGRLHHRLASVNLDQGKHQDAEGQFKSALAIYQKADGQPGRSVAQVLERYAELLEKTNRRAEAEKARARAKEIREKLAKKSPSK